MIVQFDKSFDKSLKKISDKKILAKLKEIIIEFGDYRLGIELIDEVKIRLILVAHRKEIYRKFP